MLLLFHHGVKFNSFGVVTLSLAPVVPPTAQLDRGRTRKLHPCTYAFISFHLKMVPRLLS